LRAGAGGAPGAATAGGEAGEATAGGEAGAGNPTWAAAGKPHKTVTQRVKEAFKGNASPPPRNPFAITVQGIRKSPHTNPGLPGVTQRAEEAPGW